jgi:hypothetical protein
VEAAVDRSDASALADLQMHWDEAYVIGLDGDIWLARFHGSADELRAHTSTELRELIRADYAYRQQVRRVRATRAGTEEASAAPDDNDSGRSGEDGSTDHADSGPTSGGGGDIPDLDDADVDDDDYAAHFDRAHADGAQLATGQFDRAHIARAAMDTDSGGSPGDRHPHDAEPGREAGLSRAAVTRGGYANLRGERMST